MTLLHDPTDNFYGLSDPAGPNAYAFTDPPHGEIESGKEIASPVPGGVSRADAIVGQSEPTSE